MTVTPPIPDQQMMLCFNVYATSLAFSRFYRPFLAPLGLTYPQYLVMLSLHQQDGKTLRALTAELGLESNTLSPLLQRMAKAGQIERSRGSVDERTVNIHLTATGRQLAVQAALVPDCVRACIDLPDDEIARTAAALGRLRAQLEAGAAQDRMTDSPGTT